MCKAFSKHLWWKHSTHNWHIHPLLNSKNNPQSRGYFQTHFGDEQIKMHTSCFKRWHWACSSAIKCKVYTIGTLLFHWLRFFKNRPNEEAGGCDLNKETNTSFSCRDNLREACSFPSFTSAKSAEALVHAGCCSKRWKGCGEVTGAALDHRLVPMSTENISKEDALKENFRI